MSLSHPPFVDPGAHAALSFRVRFDSVTSDDPDPASADVATLSLVGELDCDTAPDLISILDGIDAVGFTRIDVDAGGVGFLDCSGLRVLEQTAAYLSTQGGSLQIVDPSPAVSRLLAITGTDDLAADR